MELVIEFFLELLLEGSVAVVTEKKVPIWLRILAGIVLLAFCLLIFGVLAIISLELLNDRKTAAACFVLAIGLLMAGSLFYAVRKKYQEYKNKK